MATTTVKADFSNPLDSVDPEARWHFGDQVEPSPEDGMFTDLLTAKDLCDGQMKLAVGPISILACLNWGPFEHGR